MGEVHDLGGYGLEEEEKVLSFEDCGVPLVISFFLRKESFAKPLPIQTCMLPCIRWRADLVVRAKNGSGKTFGYLISVLQMFVKGRNRHSSKGTSFSPGVVIIVPRTELCQNLVADLNHWIELIFDGEHVPTAPPSTYAACHPNLVSLEGNPEIVVSTPECVPVFANRCHAAFALIIDEVDEILSSGHEDALNFLISLVPKTCQRIVVSENPSADTKKLTNFVIRNPYVATLPALGGVDCCMYAYNAVHFYVSSKASDKLLSIVALLEFGHIRKVLLFTNSDERSHSLMLFFNQMDWRSEVLHAELSEVSRMRIFEGFRDGLIEILIATDDDDLGFLRSAENRELLREQGPSVKRQRIEGIRVETSKEPQLSPLDGIDFEVVNFDMPQTTDGYARRIDFTRRSRIGTCISLVSHQEMDVVERIKYMLEDGRENKEFICPFRSNFERFLGQFRYKVEETAEKAGIVVERDCDRIYRIRSRMDDPIRSDPLMSCPPHCEENA